MSDALKANPFMHAGFWYWTDERACTHGPYKTQLEALRGLIKYMLPPWYARLANNVKEFFHDTRG